MESLAKISGEHLRNDFKKNSIPWQEWATMKSIGH